MKNLFTYTLALGIMMSITFAAKAETAKEILRRKMKTEALSFFNARQYDKALDLYLQLSSEQIEKGQIDYMIGMCYLSTNEKNKALPYLISAESSNENTFVLNYYLGKAYFNVGDYSKSINYLNTYLVNLDECKGLKFKNVKNVADQHKVHFEKSKKDVSRLIEICKSKLIDTKGTQEASKANTSEGSIYQDLTTDELQAVPAAK